MQGKQKVHPDSQLCFHFKDEIVHFDPKLSLHPFTSHYFASIVAKAEHEECEEDDIVSLQEAALCLRNGDAATRLHIRQRKFQLSLITWPDLHGSTCL